MLTRSKPLARKTRLRQRRPGAPRRSARVRDRDYMDVVRSLPCVLAGIERAGPCSGPIEVDHLGERGLGQKSSDLEVCSICRGHHRARTDHTGYFANRTKDERARWKRWAIAKTAQGVALKLSRNPARRAADAGGT